MSETVIFRRVNLRPEKISTYRVCPMWRFIARQFNSRGARLIILFVSVMSATASHAQSRIEGTVTYALESLSSGVSATTVLGDTQVVVKPLRTWKSISGHYCRRYQVIVTQPASASVRSESTRCRDSGVWKLVSDG